MFVLWSNSLLSLYFFLGIVLLKAVEENKFTSVIETHLSTFAEYAEWNLMENAEWSCMFTDNMRKISSTVRIRGISVMM